MEPIISVRALGKSYRIRTAEKRRYSTLRDDLTNFSSRLLHGKFGRVQTEDFCALKNIDIEIYPGEVAGIIGRNGAGKSTLLKILSRITPPTRGEAILRGRVASLLEVGTGFHPELTGRENIFMSGAVLGMKRTEIKQKFDEIVSFAEIEKFLDTPVKRYSSGMYVRLAFAVASHLESEILLVDEVLAVGDAQFQKKCLGKMGDIATKEDRTVLFVSHNMATIQNLCQTGILLDRGQIQFIGNVDQAISKYLHGFRNEDTGSTLCLEHHDRRRPKRPVLMKRVELLVNGESTNHLKVGDSLQIVLWLQGDKDFDKYQLWILVENELNQRILTASTKCITENPLKGVGKKATVSCVIPNLPLYPGTYYLSLFANDGKSNGDAIDQAIDFTVHPHDVFGSGYMPERNKGLILWNSHWEALKDYTD